MTMNTTIKSLALIGLLIPTLTNAQERFASRTGHVAFRSETPIETIEANNHKATSVYDPSTGALEFAVLIKAFEFEKALREREAALKLVVSTRGRVAIADLLLDGEPWREALKHPPRKAP